MASVQGPFGPGTPISYVGPSTSIPGARYINPATRDYQKDATTGQLATMPTTRQRVLLTLLTIRGSSTALPEFGIALPTKMGPTFESEVDASVRASLRVMTDSEKSLRIDGIVTERGASGRARVTVSYTDLLDGSTDSVTA